MTRILVSPSRIPSVRLACLLHLPLSHTIVESIDFSLEGGFLIEEGFLLLVENDDLFAGDCSSESRDGLIERGVRKAGFWERFACV